MAEAGISESSMLSLMGHMSRAMLERYSHIRMAAKREAVESLSVRSKTPKTEVVSTISTTVDQPVSKTGLERLSEHTIKPVQAADSLRQAA
jgi:hypothetical protein